ncbi:MULTISPECIES: site-specific DNA-methyltransferase [unclassified Lysobacter]|uniref:site-specific DNA-methyltransferase n=1 Tax=unclassified Lysobacter TaxID=2635362 RepID=UPI001BE4EFBB|nr:MULTISPECIES: site-specific DNA-methyltransferase [unclassified Lysobacter]MBT2748278.1 site-specific DNA-methyltransferase [Lysobacter sp. ISL-42]MBT2749955.1 site-specific DNA-methyltransferase [Lysobacter sp. ISL-50]MBT2781283.1 site-specific DNA-methyltransferase [Lysobacter sp. ISL-52]
MTQSDKPTDLLARLGQLNAPELRRLLVEHLTKRKLGLTWERNAIEHDEALNADIVLPRLVPELSHKPTSAGVKFVHRNLIIEGDNFDALRLLKATHAGRIRVIYIDPPYNTGNKDWVYNDDYVGKSDRYRHSVWLEFLYQRLMLARDLLTQDGVILVSINDENRARLEMLMDEVFPGRRVGSLVWRTRDTTSAKDRNFSDVHEHILVYGNEEFAFNGTEKTQKKYKNPDKDPRGPWNGDPLTLAFDRLDRENLYYPLHDPKRDRWYPCDENRVWAYATEARVEDTTKLQSETMEEWVRQEKILFPEKEETRIWNSKEELLAAIDAGDVPVTPKRRRPLLTRETPNLDFWVGKVVGFGRPLFKKHWSDLRSHTNPLGSWIARLTEIFDDEDFSVLRSPQAGEGTEVIQEVFGSKAFQYPKPPTLIRNLLAQTTKPGDIVLDFFAGSGTTGQAVLELNADDDGERRYIMCSSTEATAREPNKNICRDITAERMRRISQGFAGKSGYAVDQGGEFAYLQLDKFAPADLPFEAAAVNAMAHLSLRLTHAVWEQRAGLVQHIARAGDHDILICLEVNARVVEELVAWPQANGVQRLGVYCDRPVALQEALEARGIDANCHSLAEALLGGQARGRA